MSKTIKWPVKPDVEWSNEGIDFALIHTTMGHWCGYCCFPERPTIERGYNGVLAYVPVHGGITYSNEHEQGMTYGFDCAHFDDDTNPDCRDETWLRRECEHMALGIMEAAKIETEYLTAKQDEERTAILIDYEERMAALGAPPVWNMLKALNMLSGRL